MQLLETGDFMADAKLKEQLAEAIEIIKRFVDDGRNKKELPGITEQARQFLKLTGGKIC